MQEKSLEVEDDLIGTVIDEEEILQDYEPSQSEIMSYAVQLGMKPEEDKTFLYLALEGLKAPIPKPWSACRTKNGRIFYYNFETGESQWDHPSDKSYKEKFEQLKREHRSKNFLSKSDLSVISDIMPGSNIGEINILNSKNFPESLNFSGINAKNEEDIARQSISHRSNVLSDEFRRNLEKINPDREYSSHNAEQQQNELSGVDKKDFMSGMSLISQDRKGNSSEDMLNQRVNSEDVKNIMSENNEEQEENLLGELEVSSISAFQKYEDDLKAQFGYVLSEFERNYQDHVAKIEQQYQKEIEKPESDSDSAKKGSENSDIQKEMRSFETKLRVETEEDLKKQIVEVNMNYEAKRKEMEERAEREIQQCLYEVREKCQSGFQELANEKYFSRVKKSGGKSGHKRAHSMLTQEDQIQKAKEEEAVWSGKRNEVEVEYQSKGARLEEELANKYETDLSNYRSETSNKLEDDIQIYQSRERQIEAKSEVWKDVLQKEYQNRLNLQKNQMKQEYLLCKLELEATLKQKDIKNSAFVAIENSLKAEFDAKIKSIQIEKTLLEQQFQKLREMNHQQAKEKLQLVRDCLNNEENELASNIKQELRSLEKQIAEREGLLSWLRNDKKAADDIEKTIAQKEKDIKGAQKEIDDLETKVDQLKRQAKLNKNEYEEKQNNKTAEKVSVLDKISELSRRLDRVEVEIDLIKQKPQEITITRSPGNHPNINMGALHSPKGFNKIFRGVQEIKKVIAQKHRRSTSVEKVHMDELSFDMPSSTKVNRTGIRGYRAYYNARRSSLEPKSELEESYTKGSIIEKLSPIRPKQTAQQQQGLSAKKLLSDSKMMSFEWEEEEEKESQKVEKKRGEDTKESRFSAASPSKIQSDWRSLIKIEKGLLVKYSHLVQKQKIETRIIQNTLEKEQTDYKVEYIQYKNDPYKTYSKKLKLEVLKKALNSKIQDYNKSLSWLRSQEGIMTSKRDLLKNLENTFDKACQHKNFDEDALFDLYKVFKSIQLDLSISEEFKDIGAFSFIK